MAGFEVFGAGLSSTGADAEADILFELGMMFATGRDGETDMVAAHKWFNIAAIKGSHRAAELRAELSAQMSKADIANTESGAALRGLCGNVQDWIEVQLRP